MSRYIDADKLIERLKKDPLYSLVERYGITGVIENEPTADVAEVKHGRWYHSVDEGWTCSVCRTHIEDMPLFADRSAAFEFCPHCGALMMDEAE